MVNWFLNESLDGLSDQIREEYPGTVIYSIGDASHSKNPDASQHAPDRGGKKPGDDKGEVDAIDVMPNPKAGLTLDKLFEIGNELRKSKDNRLLYGICKDKIFSAVTVPWMWRDYGGKYHSHLHVSVNDAFDNNQSPWRIEAVAKHWEFETVEGARLPKQLLYGYDDAAYDGYDHVGRLQSLLNFQDRKRNKPLDMDGVFGANTALKVRQLFGGTGKVVTFDQLRKLHGI